MPDIPAPSDLRRLGDYVDHESDAAFESLVARHAGWVFACAYRQLHDRQLAEDATQTVFLLLVQRASIMRSHPKLSGWLFNTLHYAVKDIRRAARRREFHERRAAIQKFPASSPPTHHDEIAAQLDAAVYRLRGPDRTAILLRFYQDLSFEQIADSLNVTEEAARKRVSRAIHHLRKRLANPGDPACLSAATSVGLAVVPATLTQSITHAALSAKTGALPAATVTAMKGTAFLMATGKLKTALVLLCTSALLAIPVVIITAARSERSPAVAPTSSDRFGQDYRLEAGVGVRRIAFPFPASRMEYYRTKEARQAAAIPKGPDAMIIAWRKGQPVTWSMHFENGRGGFDAQWLLHYVLDLAPEEIEGLKLLGIAPIRGDYVLDLDAAEERRRANMESIFSEAAGRPIILSFRNVSRTVTVLSGKWQRKDPDGKPLDSPTAGVIQLYGEKYNAAGVSGDTPVSGLAKAIGSWIQRPVVIEAEGAPAIDNVRWNNNAIYDKGPEARDKAHDPELVLKHITEQTGLTPSQQTRTVRRLIIEAAGPSDVLLLPNDSFMAANPDNFSADLDGTVSRSGGRPALLLSSATAKPTDAGAALRRVDIKPFLGKRVRFSAYIKSGKLTNWGGLKLDVFDHADRTLAADEMIGRGITRAGDWKRFEIVCDIAPQATSIRLGVHIKGSGQLWMDGARLEVVGNDVLTTDDHNKHLYTLLAASYSATVDPAVQRNGHPTLCIAASPSKPAGAWCWYGWNIRATEPYQGHRIRVSAWIKTQGVSGVAHLAVWARPEGNLVRIDDPATRTSIKGATDWKKYELIADIPGDLNRFDPGVNLAGAGKIWIDEVQYELLPDDPSGQKEKK